MENSVMSDESKDEKHASGISKYNPSTAEWLEILDALREEAEQGKLACLVFGLTSIGTDKTMVEHFGNMQTTEVACRAVLERVAVQAQKYGRADVAKAIRSSLKHSATSQ